MKPNYEIVEDTDTVLCLRDLGPWPPHLTITNGVEEVVAELAERLGKRRLEYYDSEGNRDQILVREGKFIDFGQAGVQVIWVKQEPLKDKDYLGDSVYAQHDGYHIVLTTEGERPTTRTPVTLCPTCDCKLDAATSITGAQAPGPGDFSLCIGCGEVLIYDESMLLRRLEQKDLDELTEEVNSQLLKAQKLIREERAKRDRR